MMRAGRPPLLSNVVCESRRITCLLPPCVSQLRILLYLGDLVGFAAAAAGAVDPGIATVDPPQVVGPDPAPIPQPTNQTQPSRKVKYKSLVR